LNSWDGNFARRDCRQAEINASLLRCDHSTMKRGRNERAVRARVRTSPFLTS
jgi:hypothetical protein